MRLRRSVSWIVLGVALVTGIVLALLTLLP